MLYSKNYTNWKPYTFGSDLSLNNEDVIVFSGLSHSQVGNSGGKLQFEMDGNGTLEVSGNLSSLYGDGTALSQNNPIYYYI